MNLPAPAARPRSTRRADRSLHALAATRFFVIIGLLGALIVYSASALWRHDPAALFWTTLGYFAYDVGLSVLLVTAAGFGLRARRQRAAVSAVDAAPLAQHGGDDRRT